MVVEKKVARGDNGASPGAPRRGLRLLFTAKRGANTHTDPATRIIYSLSVNLLLLPEDVSGDGI